VICALATLPLADVTIHEPGLEEALAVYYRAEHDSGGPP
jgi:hypothetical protein